MTLDKDQKTGDASTDEILEEMKEDGIEIPRNVGEAEEEDNSDQTTTDPELEESEEESTEAAKEGDSKDDEESDEEDESEEDDEDDDAESGKADEAESEGEEEGEGGKPLTLAEKYRREKKLRKEAEGALAKALTAKSDEQFDEEVKKFATDNKMNVATAKGLIELAAKRAGLSTEVNADLQAIRKERRNHEYWNDQSSKFRKDFQQNVLPVLKEQGMKDADIQATYASLFGRVDPVTGVPIAPADARFWAFDKSNKDKSLVSLALGMRRASSSRTSSESGGTRRVRTQSGKEPSELTSEDINEMSDKEFDELSDGLAKGSRQSVHHS